MNELHFLRPYFLLLIVPVLIWTFFSIFKSHHKAGPWQNICSKDLLPYILAKNNKRHYFSYIFTAFGLLLLIVAASGPAWQQISQPLIKQKAGLVIALDLSPAMDAQDIKPSRLQRAIYKINDFLEMHLDGQVALIAFSGNPFVVTPLTDDIATIKNLLPALETRIMPSVGHRTHLAIDKAADLLKQSGINNGSILLITSELSNQEMEASIAAAQQQQLKVSVLGVGTEETAPIPQAGGGFVKTSDGAMVMATLSKNNLSKLARSTGGNFATISVDDHDLRQLSHVLPSNINANSHEQTELKLNRWHDQGYLLVLLALPLTPFIFRRGVLVVALFLLPQMAQALSFNDLWKTKDQQAQELFKQEKYAEAKDLFQNEEWQAACNYKLGDYERAAQLYQDRFTAEGFFNYGTSKAKLGDFESALEAYEKALELEPQHEDALYNKNVIEEFLKQNQNQDKDKDQEKDKKDKKNKQNSDQDKNKSDSDKNNKKDQSQDQDIQDKQLQDQDKESQEQQQGEDKEEGKEQDQKQKENSQENDSSDEPGKSSDVKEQNLDDLNEQYRENVEKEMQKEEAQLSENETKAESKAKPQELKAETEEDAQRHIDERWLKRIQDDPAGLLRRKFQQQYRQQQKTK